MLSLNLTEQAASCPQQTADGTETTSPYVFCLDLTNVKNQPLISVITSSYNRGRYLEQAIESVLQQTYTNWELIIVDDGSHKPEALEVLRRYGDPETGENYDPRIHVHYLYTNYGDSQFPKNYGIYQSKGEFIAIFDDDDIMLPERLLKQVHYMLVNPQIDVLGAKMKVIDENDVILYDYFSRGMDNEEMRLNMVFLNYMAHSTAFIRYNDKNREYVYYNLICAEDYDLWLRLMYEHNFHFEILDEFLVLYRVHTAKARKEENVNRDFTWIHYKIREIYPKAFSFIYGKEYDEIDFEFMNCLVVDNLQECLYEDERSRLLFFLLNFYDYYSFENKNEKMSLYFRYAIINVGSLKLEPKDYYNLEPEYQDEIEDQSITDNNMNENQTKNSLQNESENIEIENEKDLQVSELSTDGQVTIETEDIKSIDQQIDVTTLICDNSTQNCQQEDAIE